MDHVADAVHVEDHEILPIGIHHAFEFADQFSVRSSGHPGAAEQNPGSLSD